jgi:hypothetical protein
MAEVTSNVPATLLRRAVYLQQSDVRVKQQFQSAPSLKRFWMESSPANAALVTAAVVSLGYDFAQESANGYGVNSDACMGPARGRVETERLATKESSARQQRLARY